MGHEMFEPQGGKACMTQLSSQSVGFKDCETLTVGTPCESLVQRGLRKSTGVSTVRKQMLMIWPKMQFMRPMNISSSLSKEIGSWHWAKAEGPTRIKIALILVAVAHLM